MSEHSQSRRRSLVRSLWQLGLFALLDAAFVASNLSVAYLDFGDGNYLYISSRLADGLVLYRDILAPQPPCHLLVGSLLIRLGRLLGHNRIEAQLYTVRVFSLLLHLATLLVVWAIALRLFRRAGTALWAAAIYLVLPVGLWWTMGYQSEPLEMFFLLLSFLLLIRWERWSLAAAGLLAALGISTNMTAVPYVGWAALFLIVCDWRRAVWYVVPMIALGAVVVGLGEWLSGGHYLENVFFNQVGTFPHPDLLQTVAPGAPFRTVRTILGYALSKIAREGADMLALEGIFVSAAVAGVLLYLRNGSRATGCQAVPPEATGCQPAPPEAPSYHRSFVGWYAFWSFMAICFVSKGATEDYIFSIGEPFVCLFAAYAITELSDRMFGGNPSPASRSPHPRALAVMVAVVGFVVLFARPALWISQIVEQRGVLELRTGEVKKVRSLIEQNSKPGDAILAAPYFAFIAQRRLIEEYSELFIWDIKYLLEQQVEHTEGPATRKVEAIAGALRRKAIPVVVVNEAITAEGPQPMQVFGAPSVREALAQNYRSVLPQPIRGLNAWVDVLAPAK